MEEKKKSMTLSYEMYSNNNFLKYSELRKQIFRVVDDTLIDKLSSMGDMFNANQFWKSWNEEND